MCKEELAHDFIYLFFCILIGLFGEFQTIFLII